MWSWIQWLVWTWWVRGAVAPPVAREPELEPAEAEEAAAPPPMTGEPELAEAPQPAPVPSAAAQVPVERAVRVYLQKHRLGIQMTGLEGVDASGLQKPPQELWFMNSAN